MRHKAAVVYLFCFAFEIPFWNRQKIFHLPQTFAILSKYTSVRNFHPNIFFLCAVVFLFILFYYCNFVLKLTHIPQHNSSDSLFTLHFGILYNLSRILLLLSLLWIKLINLMRQIFRNCGGMRIDFDFLLSRFVISLKFASAATSVVRQM